MTAAKRAWTPGRNADAPPKLKHVATVKRAKSRHQKRGKKRR